MDSLLQHEPPLHCTRGSVDMRFKANSHTSVAERVWEKVYIPEDQPDACWPWLANKDKDGYGKVTVKGKYLRAHRVMYELVREPISTGLQIDHLCSNTSCVRPSHLEAVTLAENLRRSPGTYAGRNSRKTHCPQGHPYDEVNTYLYRGGRSCRSCLAERRRKRK